VTQLTNTALVADDGQNGTDPTPADNTATATTPVTGTPDLRLSKSDGGGVATPGNVLSYSLTAVNGGTREATGVVITEIVPANTVFNAGASSTGWTCPNGNTAGNTCTLTLGNVAGGGASRSATFAVTVAAALPGQVETITNTASVADDGSNGTDSTPNDNRASLATPLRATPDLRLSKSAGNGVVTPASVITYTLTTTNVGAQEATGVVITETVPGQTTFNAGASTAGWDCQPGNAAGSVCTLTLGSLSAGGASRDATFAVTVEAVLSLGVDAILNTASVADDGRNGADPTPNDNRASTTTPVVATPDLQLSKRDGGGHGHPGEWADVYAHRDQRWVARCVGSGVDRNRASQYDV